MKDILKMRNIIQKHQKVNKLLSTHGIQDQRSIMRQRVDPNVQRVLRAMKSITHSAQQEFEEMQDIPQRV